jgi:hypothetical protein
LPSNLEVDLARLEGRVSKLEEWSRRAEVEMRSALAELSKKIDGQDEKLDRLLELEAQRTGLVRAVTWIFSSGVAITGIVIAWYTRVFH